MALILRGFEISKSNKELVADDRGYVFNSVVVELFPDVGRDIGWSEIVGFLRRFR